MQIMRILRLLFLALFICGCSCGSSRGVMRIGIDTKWYPLDFGPQTSYVNGYIEDLLLQMHEYSGMKFELISMNWDATIEGLRGKKYDAMFTSILPLPSNQAKYDFSEIVLHLGPVLIVPIHAKKTSLNKMDGESVGIIVGSQCSLILESYPTIMIRTYANIADLLNAVSLGDIQAALLPSILASNYVRDLYSGRLKIVGDPLNDSGIRLMGPHGQISRFNKMLAALKKRKIVDSLQKKWQLSSS